MLTAAATLALIPISREVFWGPMAYAMMDGIVRRYSFDIAVPVCVLCDVVPHQAVNRRWRLRTGAELEPAP